jgi:hypothetical protein
MKQLKRSVKTKIPWYELDRVILTAIGPHEWTRTLYIVRRVRRKCGHTSVSNDEVFQRICVMIELGTIWCGGDLWLWRQRQSVLYQGLDL